MEEKVLGDPQVKEGRGFFDHIRKVRRRGVDGVREVELSKSP